MELFEENTSENLELFQNVYILLHFKISFEFIYLEKELERKIFSIISHVKLIYMSFVMEKK